MLTAGLCTAHTETTQISINYPVDKLERGHAMQYTQQWESTDHDGMPHMDKSNK